MVTERELSAILAIPTSVVSMRDSLLQVRYRELRPFFNTGDLLRIVTKRPVFIEQWLRYSEDKRTSGGWYVLETCEVGELTTGTCVRFGSLPEAISEYVVRELDFWVQVGNSDKEELPR